ncbi:4Fe-4S dicluster domain-containing protein [Symbiobacterium terraclitae]|uniref:4Fe-4S dicluster domain-containing protein n=1 Tax=Symbiobacterium terraclitae TaxID=557451 RepID=UPI0035B50A3E
MRGLRKRIGWRALRLATQALFWALFLAPLAGFPWFRGTYVASRLAGIPLTDPYGAAQAAVAGGLRLAGAALLGLGLVALVYLLLGRAFCAWVCPLGSLLELADRAAERFLSARRAARRGEGRLRPAGPLARPATDRLHPGGPLPPQASDRLPLAGRPARLAALPRWTRWAIAIGVLLLTALTGQALFEWVSPQANLMRSLLFGFGLQLLIVAAVVAFDLFVLRRGWCRSLCPAGALYSLLGRFAPLRVGHDRSACDRCGACVQACPWDGRETLLETVAGRGRAEANPWTCANCGDCIDACPQGALRFTPAWRVAPAERPVLHPQFSRRQAIGLMGGAVAVAGLSVARPMLAAPEERRLLRPPGALPEAAFVGLCLRCGQCAQACPRAAIRLAGLAGGLGMGTPYIVPRRVACDLCKEDGPACVAVCPTGALTLEPGAPVRMGVAEVDTERCIAHMGAVCRTCFVACPLQGTALILEGALRPAVDPAVCTGCGLCEEHCIVEPAAIAIRPVNEHA